MIQYIVNCKSWLRLQTVFDIFWDNLEKCVNDKVIESKGSPSLMGILTEWCHAGLSSSGNLK